MGTLEHSGPMGCSTSNAFKHFVKLSEKSHFSPKYMTSSQSLIEEKYQLQGLVDALYC